jgi:hypothetical protein
MTTALEANCTVCTVAPHLRPRWGYRYRAMNATPFSATTAIGVTNSRPITKSGYVSGVMVSSAVNAMRWTSVTAAKRWYAVAAPLYCLASFAVPACAKSAPQAAAAAGSSSASGTSSSPSSVTPANFPTASSAWPVPLRSLASDVASGKVNV